MTPLPRLFKCTCPIELPCGRPCSGMADHNRLLSLLNRCPSKLLSRGRFSLWRTSTGLARELNLTGAADCTAPDTINSPDVGRGTYISGRGSCLKDVVCPDRRPPRCESAQFSI